MIIALNGPVGIGKSTLAEALTESIDRCVMLDGDRLIAANPPYHDEYEYLHSTIALLIAHHFSYGYRHSERHIFVQEHELLAANSGMNLGEPFDVSEPPEVLVKTMLQRLGLR